MPELPEVETLRRSLLPVLVGRRVERIEIREKRLRNPVDARRLRRHVVDRRVEDVTRQAKYLLVHLEGRRCLLLHLGMSGRLLLVPVDRPLGEHVHVRFRLDGAKELRFRDPRRFGLVDSLRSSEIAKDRRFVHLGPEPLSDDCDASWFRERSRGVRRPVKNFIMDARQVVGVGNIYACEALFAAGIHPLRPAGRVGPARWEKLAAAIRRVLRDAIHRGGTTLKDFCDAEGTEGHFQVSLRVYGREGEACSGCGGSIRRRVMAGRSTFYCPRCQR